MSSDPEPIKAGDHVYLIDGSTYIFRAYFAMFKAAEARGRSFTRSDGTPTAAVMTFCNMLWKVLRDGVDDHAPSHIAAVFDKSGRSFRNDIYPDYKAHRPDPPEDLIPQFPLIRDAVRSFGLNPVEQEGFEADDIIATYARIAEEAGAEVTIISGDKDLMQLISPGVRMYDPMPGRERFIGEKEVAEKFGVGPDKVVEVQALAGDSTDNVPGVPGIGVKTAAQLIDDYGDLETLLGRAEEIKQTKRRENLIEFAEQARISRKLVELRRDVPLEVGLETLTDPEIDARVLVAFCKAMEFRTLTERVAATFGIDADEIEADPKLAAGANGTSNDDARATPAGDDAGNAPSGAASSGDTSSGDTGAAAVAARAREAVTAIKIDPDAYETVTTMDRLNGWIEAAHTQGLVAVDTETNSLDAMRADLVGVSLALEPGRACYIPLRHRAGEGLALEGDTPDQIAVDDAIAALKPLLEDPGVLKVGQNLKYDWQILAGLGIEIAPIDDTMLLSYVLDSGLGGHGMDELSERHLGHRPIPFKEVAGTGKSKVTFDLVPVDKATRYAAEDADVTLRLYRILKPRLVAERMVTVYETLERPMVETLARMEREGVSVDRQVLSRQSGDFAQGLARIEAEVHELAGEKFNIGSTRQLGEILYDKMSLDGGRKTKSGGWSTGADVLEQLAAEGHDLPARVLEWRQLAKLKSTYTDALPEFINPDTRRVHTSYALAATSTGRLASSEPNLQNIPVRTEAGRKIRTAFVAEKGNKLLSADYSQIELRILAHIADIPELKSAFAEGLDIHAMTASEIFDVPIEGMDPSVRRRAKAINFGIIYGISAFGLANQLSISRSDAKAYIDTYFERFPGIRAYMDRTIETARDQGFVTTLFGRKCHYPDIKSNNPGQRGFMERAAINAPIQGTAADIIRRAMIRMPAALRDSKLKTRMLLQVHDELIFELPDGEVEKATKVIREVMENAAEPVVKLAVPLQVDARAADNWEEAH